MNKLLTKPIPSLVSALSIRNGDHSAFLALYNDIHLKVYHFFLKKVRLDHLAKELTQQTFIRVWQFRQTLSDNHPLHKQVFIIAHSLLVNHFEKAYQLKKLHAMRPAAPEAGTDMEQAFEVSNQVQTAIDTLPPVRKKVLLLKAFHDYSNKEIASEMNISVKTVEDHVTRAFRQMKQVMSALFPILITGIASGYCG